MGKARRVRGRMNQLEAEYEALFLGQLPHLFESVTLILADDLRYTPDFMVIAEDDVVEMREIKGHWREDAKIKIRMAARLFPWFRFKAYSKQPKALGGQWQMVHFGQADSG